MLLGPGMEWPKAELSYSLSRQKKMQLAYMCVATELHIRGILAGFKDTRLQKIRAFFNPKPPVIAAYDSFPEVFAWQYYLDHKSVLLRYCMLQFRMNKQPDGSPAATNMLQRILLRSFEHLEQQIKYIGAPHTLADNLLYQARYKLSQDLDFAQHLWSLINLPIGRALAFLEQGRDYMQEGKNEDAVWPFVFSHYISIMSGSHLAALKALIGLSHVGISVRESVWNFSVGMLQGREHTEFFRNRATHMHLVTRASLPVPRKFKMPNPDSLVRP